MHLRDTPEHEAFRAEARAWIQAHAPREALDTVMRLRFTGMEFADWLPLARTWQKRKYDAGHACLQWPAEHGGRGVGPAEDVIWREEEGAYARLNEIFLITQYFIAPTLMTFAGDEQQRAHLPGMASGESIWCQLFSEPGGGSDLAAVRTRAVRAGDGWKLSGQKIWTSGAQYADHGMVLARTDPDKPKHKGLTMFFLRMDAPGVTVRPIRLMSGHHDVNEVFFDDVLVPDAQRLGSVDDGWRTALTTLMNERMAIGSAIPSGIEELLQYLASLRLADGSRAIDHADVRQRVARCYAQAAGIRNSVWRQLAALRQGTQPGPEGAIAKLVRGRLQQEIASFALDLAEARGRCEPDANDPAFVFRNMFFAGAVHRIEGGTDEILRNVLAERVLELPPDHRPDRDIPFRDIGNAASTGARR